MRNVTEAEVKELWNKWLPSPDAQEFPLELRHDLLDLCEKLLGIGAYK